MKQLFAPALRRWAMVGGTLSLALLSGVVMQRGEPVPPQAEIVLPFPPERAKALASPPPIRPHILETQTARSGDCRPILQMQESPTGLIGVALEAPCHRDGPIAIHVNQLVADTVTDAHGRWEARLPVLARKMQVRAVFGDHVLSAHLYIDRATEPQHVILAWSGPRVFEIRTDRPLPEGAEGAAVVRPGLAPDVTVSRIGDGRGASFEIFTFPNRREGPSGVVRLSVEARVSPANCDRAASTMAYQTGYLGGLRATEITYTMPDCDRVGEVVRLQNLFRDLRLAER